MERYLGAGDPGPERRSVVRPTRPRLQGPVGGRFHARVLPPQLSISTKGNRPTRPRRRRAPVAREDPRHRRLRFPIAQRTHSKPTERPAISLASSKSFQEKDGSSDFVAERVGFEPTVPF